MQDKALTTKLKSGENVLWLWRIKCGSCHAVPGVMLRYDSDTLGRVECFKRRKLI